MKQQTEKKLQANLKAINNDFNTVIFADIEVKFKAQSQNLWDLGFLT